MKRFIVIAGMAVVLIAAFVIYYIIQRPNEQPPIQENQVIQSTARPTRQPVEKEMVDYSQFRKHIQETGLMLDSIPPLEQPLYVSVSQAQEFMEAWDRVFVYEGQEDVYIYPQKIMVWHEIVNEEIDGEHVSITYCPLTASVIGYTGNDGESNDNTYGTSGNLLNSNLVMYDRNTGSNIPQILGVGVDADMEGVALETRPVLWSVWAAASGQYPQAKVLSLETSYRRDYSHDPYGSYTPDSKTTYYQTGEAMFPLMHDNDQGYADKKMVVGVKYGQDYIALDPVKVIQEGVVHFDVGSHPAIAVYDRVLKAVRVYDAQWNDQIIQLKEVDDHFVDDEGTVWNYQGRTSDGQQLNAITHFDVFWFAWQAYYPDTEIIE